MMNFKIISTETFSRQFKKHKKDGEFVKILSNKIKRLQEDPKNVGGYLSGKLHGCKSTRILKMSEFHMFITCGKVSIGNSEHAQKPQTN